MPTSDELEKTLLIVLSKSKNPMKTSEMVTAVGNYLFLSPELYEVRRADNRRELNYRMAWARTHLKEKGLIENVGMGLWRIVTKGASRQGS
jgi:restriction endonuclease Mrr